MAWVINEEKKTASVFITTIGLGTLPRLMLDIVLLKISLGGVFPVSSPCGGL